jgi:hypothetical protein
MMAQYSLHVCLATHSCLSLSQLSANKEEKYDFARVTLERRVVDAVEKVVHQNRMGDNAGFVRTGHGSDIHSALGIREKVWGGLKVFSTLLELG